jgi:hypothetical protein
METKEQEANEAAASQYADSFRLVVIDDGWFAEKKKDFLAGYEAAERVIQSAIIEALKIRREEILNNDGYNEMYADGKLSTISKAISLVKTVNPKKK